MRSLRLLSLSALVGCAACTTPDRDFPAEEPAATSTGVSSTGSAPTTSAATAGGGGDGTGGDTSSPASSSTGTGGIPEDGCGDLNLDEGEACDESTELCQDCQIDCPSGWFALGNSCFAVALNDVSQYDAFTADAKCGALAVGASGHRAHAAVPESLEELDSLATRCPNNGCWLGFYALGVPGDATFLAPATTQPLILAPPWAPGEPTGGIDEVCVKLLLDGDGGPILEDQPCTSLGYFACELETTFGSFSTCGDGEIDEGEECDDGDDGDDTCVDCDRRCPEDWSEDPRTHACLLPLDSPQTYPQAAQACTDAGGRLATPDEVADVRVASAVFADAWIGLEAMGIIEPPDALWISGEEFLFVGGTYPLPADPETVSDGFLLDGEIRFDLAEALHGALCEMFDPDD